MSIDADNSYSYRDLGKYVVSVDQSVLRTILNFVVRYSANSLESLGVSRRTSLSLLKAVAKSKSQRSRSDRIASYPVFGHIGMRVHRGYKFFDFDKGIVTKVFGATASAEEAESEIAASRAASSITAAPRFISADEHSRWFSEEYIRGTHATDIVSPTSSDYLRYYNDIEKCLLELALSEEPVRVRVSDHVNEVSSNTFRDRWERGGCGESDISGVEDYIEKVRGWLDSHFGDAEVDLVPTHGDFSLVNAILTKGGLRFIDWEGIGPGILYSDVYNLMFAERYYGRTSNDFVDEVRGTLRQFREAITRHGAGLREVAHQDQDVLRRIYYLERIRLLVEREVTPNLVSVVKKSIDMFDEFDRLTEDPAT